MKALVASCLALSCLAAAGLAAAATPRKPLDVRDLANFERVSAPTLSPDGRKVVFAVRRTDFAANKGLTSLYIEDLYARDAAPPVPFSPEGMNVNSPAFSADGRSVYFLSAKSGSMQLWVQPVAGGEALQVSDFAVDVGSFKPAPDGRRIAVSLEVFTDCASLACTKRRLEKTGEIPKASGRIYDRAFIRHWDTWSDQRRNQLFVATIGADGKLGAEPVLVSRGIDGDVPSKPFGDAEEFNWSPDSKWLAFNAREAGKGEPWSTNFDVFVAPADGGVAPRNLTKANPAWDATPVFSPDGRTIYYRATRRPGFEADRFELMAMDADGGNRRPIVEDGTWDVSLDNVRVSADGKHLFATAPYLGQHPLFTVNLESGAARRIITQGSVSAFDQKGGTLVFVRDSLKSPGVLYAARPDGGGMRKVSVNNDAKLAQIAWGDPEQFDFKGWNDERVHGYVVKPANYVPGKKYPVAFLIHGGPQGSFGNGWSYRWNPQTYAGQGFAVVMIDFHGSVGYGTAFMDAISEHWGDRPLEDLQKGWAAALAKYDFLDGDRACALGASYGGYMVNWIAGNWPQPWKCLVSHDGIFDRRMMAYSTEELWFTEWEHGGTPWTPSVAATIEKHNPVNFVANWSVPILAIHGELDHRIPYDQGIAVFTAAQRRGIESRLLVFPDENHWVLKPQNSVLWHDTVNAWLKRWTSN